VVAGGRSRATVWFGVAIGAACFAVFSWNAPWAEIGGVLAGARVSLIVVATGFLLFTSVARAWRWRHLLGGAPVSFRHRLTSTLIGFAGNNALPGRLGEPLRCLAISRLDRRIGFWQAAGSILIERIFDLAAALTALVAFVIIAPFPPDAAIRDAALFASLERHGAVLAAAVVVVAAAAALFARRRMRVGDGWYARIARLLTSLQRGFTSLRSARAVAASLFFTALLWTSMLTFDFLMLRAFGFDELGPAHALGLLVVLSFAIALPQAPAGLGVVQLASETTLTALYDMPLARAKAFAMAWWACQTTIVIAAGALALWIEGLSLADVRRASTVVDDLRNETPAG
jgi:uncharacterized protein (TIRG00374 family)